MCTAICNGRLFGRTLDLEFSYGEGVVLLPRNAPYRFRFETPVDPPLAILGTAYCYGGVPLFYDAMNESGLAAAIFSARLPNPCCAICVLCKRILQNFQR